MTLRNLAALLRQQAEESRRDLHIDPRAQAMELRDRYMRCTQPSTLKPGDLAKERLGCAIFTDNPMLILWRLLDWNDPNDKEIARDHINRYRVNRLDCMIARLPGDGHMQITPHELARLEPYEEGSE